VNAMEDGFRLQNANVAIVGLGLMGGSLALALKGKCAALYGIDSLPATLELALAQKIVDRADSDPAKLLPQADLVILATPVPVIIDFIEKLPALTQNPCIVLDLGSTKRDIVQAMAALPERFDPVGGHPICGLENADADLYRGATFVVTTLERTTGWAKSAMQEIISAIGSHAAEMAVEDHDRVLAATSHLPCVLSTTLALCTPQEFSSFIGTGFKSTSRLAGTPVSMTMGIYKSNRDNILNAIQSFRSSLDRIEAALRHEDYAELELLLNQSRAAYQSLIAER
jgi:prephenate dehydrogenase